MVQISLQFQINFVYTDMLKAVIFVQGTTSYDKYRCILVS